MKLNFLKPGVELKAGLEEGQMEIEYIPGIPMDVLFGSVPTPSLTDTEERNWLLKECEVAIHELEKEELSRKALFYNTHESDLRVNCINLFHFTIREGKLDLYVYARSTNLRNLGYDLCTIDLVYRKVFDRLKVTQMCELGKITVHLHSLHYYK